MKVGVRDRVRVEVRVRVRVSSPSAAGPRGGPIIMVRVRG